MSTHHHHIARTLPLLKKRADLIRSLREWFWHAHFFEVETPLIVKLPGQEPYLSPVALTFHDDKKTPYTAFLHTSPEYTMKKLLAAGSGDLFFLGKTFRDYESFGGTHNPEFTMLEWYRVGATMVDLMDDVEDLISTIQKETSTSEITHRKSQPMFERTSMKDVWMETITVNLDDYLTQETMYALCKERGYEVASDEPYENLFYTIFLNEIESTFLEKHPAIIIHHYPAPMAALAQLSKAHPGYAERFEVYMNGMEIANAFAELTDSTEQRTRLEEEQLLRKQLGKTIYDLDEDFLKAVGQLPTCAGIALGVDRLIQVLTDCKNIDDVLVLPSSELFYIDT